MREPLDPASATHLLPGAPPPSYASDPPTSGAHLPGRHPTGRLDQPLEGPVQVTLLEEGQVLIQHRGISIDDRAQLESLSAEHVTVAPNPDLPSPIVATAWQYKQRCNELDLVSLRAFITNHAGKGAE